MSYRTFVLIVGLLSIFAGPAKADDMLDCEAQEASSDDLQLYVQTDLFGAVKEIIMSGTSVTPTTTFAVIESTPTHYRAKVAAPQTRDSASEIYVDRLSGNLTLTHHLAKASLKPLLDHCDQLITDKECMDREMGIKGGNPYACFGVDEDCKRWRIGNNMLRQWHYFCQKGEQKF